jgi:hypothetical protein
MPDMAHPSRLITLSLDTAKSLAVAIAVAAAAIVMTHAAVVTPVSSGMVPGAPVVINSSVGNQTDPHVSGDITAYTDESSGFAAIRYYDFFTTAAGVIVTPPRSSDQLSDVNGTHIAFDRQTGLARAAMVYDLNTAATVQIGPADSGAFATALGGDTLAFVSHDDIVVGHISNPGGLLANLSNSAAFDSGPAVSPGGNAVVWQACDAGACSILKSTFNGTSWSSATVVANAPGYNTSPDTDGTSIAYDSNRAGSIDGSDIYLQPLTGGADMQLSLPGAQRNPSIASGIVAFESTAVGASSADLFIYEISTNLLFQVTNTPSSDEQLNDVTVLSDGSIRVVWASHPDTTSDNDVFAQTFTLPAVLPVPDPSFNFVGFFQPVDNPPALNLASAGSSIPVKFSLGGDHGLTVFAAGSPGSSPIPCDASDPGTVIEETVNAGGSSLTYDPATGRYTYVWKTDRAWKGTCRMLVVTFTDNTQHLAKFRFR